MSNDVLSGLTFVSALGCGLIGGVFFAFSSFVMRALGRLPPAQGIGAMQAINITVITPSFMMLFFGTAVACLVLAGWSFFIWQQPLAIFLLVGSLLYLVGTIVVTIAFNVPRNDALAGVDPASVDGARLWASYLHGWTAWNHVRTAAAVAAAVSLTIGLCLARVA